MTRRQVVVAESFFDRLDALIPSERTPDGRPSATDFVVHELPAIVDLLAEDYVDATLPVDNAPPVRVLITSGVLVPYVAIYAHLRADDVIEVIHLDIGT